MRKVTPAMKLIYRCLCLVLGAVLGSGCSDSTDPVEYGPIAEYGVPTGTVRSRMKRGRTLLQKALWTQAVEAGLAVTILNNGNKK